MDTGAAAPKCDGGEVFGSGAGRGDQSPLLSQGEAGAGSRTGAGRLQGGGMWIIPSQLSKCAPDMVALDLDSKTSLASECEPLHIVNLRGSLKPISSVRWKRDSWMQHLFGAILKPSHTNRLTDWWTSSLRDTLASRSLPQAKEQEKKTLATSGLGSQMEFGFCDQEPASLKMSKDTSASDSERSLESWNQSVTKRRGEYSARVKSGRLTSASGSSSWPSPIASEVRQGFQDRSRGMKGSQESLTTVVVKDAANWPTPIQGDSHLASTPEAAQRRIAEGKVTLSRLVESGLPAPANPSTDGSRQESWATPRAGKTTDENPETWAKRQAKGDVATMPLTAQVKQWATPQAKDHKSGHRDATIVQYKQLNVEVEAKATGKLNPRWVETLMGLPVGWTMPSCKSPVTIALKNFACSETESSQPQPSELLESFGRNSND